MTSPFGTVLEKMLEVFREQEGDIPPDLQRQLETGLEGLWTTYDEWNASRAQELLGKRLMALLSTYPTMFRIDEDTIQDWERRAEMRVIATPRHVTNAITMVEPPEPFVEVQHDPGMPPPPEPVRIADLARGTRIQRATPQIAVHGLPVIPTPRMADPEVGDFFQAADAMQAADRARGLRWLADEAGAIRDR